MITALYVPTRGTDFLTATCVCDTPTPVSLSLRSPENTIPLPPETPGIRDNGRCFYRFSATELPPETAFTLIATQEPEPPVTLETATLPRPGGRKRVRFGILADPHCSRRQTAYGRQFEESFALFSKYTQRLAALGAEFIVVPGDMTDEGTLDQLTACRDIIEATPVPVHVVAGNHEKDLDLFHRVLGMKSPYFAFAWAGKRFICLSTASAGDLQPGSRQTAWLRSELERDRESDTFLFSHYSLVRHPSLEREKDLSVQNEDGMGALLDQAPHVRAVFSGHKNIPTSTQRRQVTHIVCPQLVQVPCGFDLIDIYDHGLVRHLFEIDEVHLDWRSRDAYADPGEIPYRYGRESDRNFTIRFDGSECP